MMMLSWIELDPAVLVFRVPVEFVAVAVEFVAVEFVAVVVFVSWRPIDPAIFFLSLLSVSVRPVSYPKEEEDSSCRSLALDRLLLRICFSLFLLVAAIGYTANASGCDVRDWEMLAVSRHLENYVVP